MSSWNELWCAGGAARQEQQRDVARAGLHERLRLALEPGEGNKLLAVACHPHMANTRRLSADGAREYSIVEPAVRICDDVGNCFRQLCKLYDLLLAVAR